MTRTNLQLRKTIGEQQTLIIIGCVLCILLGGWLAYGAYVSPETVTEQQTVSTWSLEHEFEHSAIVTEPNSVFATGTVLEDRNIYFGTLAPVLDVNYGTTYSGESDGVTVTEEATLIYRSVDDDSNVVYWSEEEPLDNHTADDLQAGEHTELAFEIETEALEDRLNNISNELGSDPGSVEVFVEAESTIEGTINGESVTLTRDHRMELDLGGNTYTVDDPGTISESFDETTTVTRTVEPGPLGQYGGPLFVLAGLVGVAGLLVGRQNELFTLTDAERDWLTYKQNRTNFDEWITTVSLPAQVHDRPYATAQTLADLVDFAIDADAAVTEDPETHVCYVLGDDLVYRFTPPTEPASTAFEWDEEAAETADRSPPTEDTDDNETLPKDTDE
ncbi:DUF5305 domain-containing protein [Natronocalculus amylovorans]|uniref:DUF5305 domain-containing protein n=1 Tax=Natronocalculus amylovorans TaxID=2917812 RepID=A0AAE3K8F9_9EURY|nr:DUF5305 domain-containing protein [Natronocalculus amylovorans]MCL9816988.1 DUF5305 domain-containing protein [Natronocalculus amylovorans]